MDSNNKKFSNLKQDYHTHTMSERQVSEMKKKINQAKKDRQKQQLSHLWKASLAAAASIVLMLLILPNTSPSVAYAMSQVPFLSKFVEVVTIRDYQYSDEHNNADIKVPELTVSTEAADTSTAAASQAKKTTAEINAEIQTITDQLIAEFEENQSQEEGYQDMVVKSETLATTDQYFTLKLICYQAAGSGAETDYYYTIDLATGKRLSLSDLFKDGSDYLTVISDNIKAQMKEQMAADESVIYWLDSDIPEWDFTSITEDTSFYLNSDGHLVICFNEGDVGPMSMGCVEFVIPDAVIASIRK